MARSGASGLERSDAATYGERQPQSELARLVAEVADHNGTDDEPQILAADGTAAVLFRRVQTGEQRAARLYAVGPRTRAIRKRSGEIVSVVAVRLRPGQAFAVLGVPLAELRDRHIELGEIWGPAGYRLADRLADAPSTEEVRRLLESALVGRVQSIGAVTATKSELAARAVSILARQTQRAETTVERLAEILDISSRQLRRVFFDAVGLSPKTLIQILRLRRAIYAAQGCSNPDWAQVALEAGFFDQSHMIAAFQRFAGATPSKYSRGKRNRRLLEQ